SEPHRQRQSLVSSRVTRSGQSISRLVPLVEDSSGSEGTVGTGSVAQVTGARRVLLRSFLARDAGSQLPHTGSARRNEKSSDVLVEGNARRWISLRCHSVSGRGRRRTSALAGHARCAPQVRQRGSDRSV